MTIHNPPDDPFARIRFRGHPVAHPDSVVHSGHARFTVLTPRLIRLEWSETGAFEDRGTYAFPTRYTPTPPHFTAHTAGGVLAIDTGALALRYLGDRFTAGSLAITFDLNGQPQTWVPGTPDPLNLRGTRRTLDQCAEDAALDEGLLSRAGWALFDDSRSVVFNQDDGWVAPRPDHDLQDWYFFGYGHDYQGALAAYTRFGEPLPLIPRFVLGAWWSRFWAYSDQDLRDLVGEFEEHDVPLDVLVIDMDWHTPDSWTGYTWNRELFPDPPAFLRWVHDKGLRATLNLHPALGVQPFEAIYPRFAEAMGVDPQSGQAIPFRITDKRFVQHYFELIHHPMEEEGVDFWWMDWQQGESSEIKGLDPLPWINHLHFQDSRRRGQRPMLYSRWGGLGNHRCYIGFSGDTYVGWPALQFQPYFTATAANVAYGWWSHDIGGHMGGATEPELYARWVQFGALSPCLRLHATKDPRAERRPWAYPDAAYRAARAAFHLRYQMIPYIYTMARVASDTGVSLCRPMYYAYPQEEAAYAARYQYFFGDQVLAAPIVHPADPETGMAATDVWIPPGMWIDYATGETCAGPRWVRMLGGLDRMPMLVRAGAILPLAPRFTAQPPPRLASGTTDALPRDWLILSVFPGAEGVFRLYEDDGVSEAYREGQYEWTEIRTRVAGEAAGLGSGRSDQEHTWTVEIGAAEGRCDALPARRAYQVCLQGSLQPQRVTVDGTASSDWTYNPETLTTSVHVPARDRRQAVRIEATCRQGISALGTARNRELALRDVRQLLGAHCPPGMEDVDQLLDAVLALDAPGREDAIARLGGPFVRFIEFATPEEAARQLGRVIVGGPGRADQPYDLHVDFTLFRGSRPEHHAVDLTGLTASRIVDTPFAFDGTVCATRWEARVDIAWRGQTLSWTYQSKPLFPTIYAWRSLVYNREKAPLPLDQVIDEQGNVNAALGWQPHVQAVAGLRNLHQPHAILFFRQYGPELRAGAPLAGYAATTIVSPGAREAVFLFRAGGPATCYLNGRQVSVEEAEEEGEVPILQREHKTEILHLRAGQNTLLIDTRPPQGGRPFWFVGGALTTPDGDLIADLAFE